MFSLQANAQHAIALPEVAWALQERDAKGADSSTKEGHLIPVAFKPSHYTRDSDGAPAEISPPLSADADKGDQDTLIAFDCKASEPNCSRELAPTLRGMQHHDGNANGGGQAAICFDTVNVTSWANRTRCDPGGPAPTMHGFGEPLTVAFERRFARNDRGAPDEVVPPLKAESGTTGKGDSAPCVAFSRCAGDTALGMSKPGVPPLTGRNGDPGSVLTGVMVRRLTPTECERLQGFEDGWTAISYRCRPAKDGPRYRALGNSMAVPVIRWIGRQIKAVTDREPAHSRV